MDTQGFWYRSGDLFLPEEITRILEFCLIGDAHTAFYISWWSMIHLTTGVFLGRTLIVRFHHLNYYLYAFILHTCWELWQVGIGNTPISTLRGRVDPITDTLMFLMGAALYKGLIFRDRPDELEETE